MCAATVTEGLAGQRIWSATLSFTQEKNPSSARCVPQHSLGNSSFRTTWRECTQTSAKCQTCGLRSFLCIDGWQWSFSLIIYVAVNVSKFLSDWCFTVWQEGSSECNVLFKGITVHIKCWDTDFILMISVTWILVMEKLFMVAALKFWALLLCSEGCSSH